MPGGNLMVQDMLQAFSNVELVYLPVAVLSCFGKKAPKEADLGGAMGAPPVADKAT